MRVKGWTFVAVVLAAALLMGCGERNAAPGVSTQPAGAIAQPKPEQPITAELRPFNSAIASSSCVRFTPLIFSTVRQSQAGAPTEANECSGFQTFLRGSQDARFSHAAEYGTAALMEAPAPGGEPAGERLVSLWALDRDGRFRATQVAGVEPAQIGTRPREDTRAEQNAAAFVGATRERDCRALEPLLNPDGRLAAMAGGSDAACKAVVVPAVRATSDARPVELGATRDFAFYGLPTEDAYFTIFLGTGGEDREQTVLDVLPNTPVDSIGGREPSP